MRCADNYGGRADSPFRDFGSTRKIAKEAVKKVYQHVSSPKDAAYIEQRKALALQFRQKYHSDVSGAPNVNPYFIGVFDTVAALGSYLFSDSSYRSCHRSAGLESAICNRFFCCLFFQRSSGQLGAAFVIGVLWYAVTHVQYAVGLPGYSFFQTLHFTAPKMQFYDKHLDNAVWYARHAMSIDENRADFARVPWGSTQNKGPPRPDSYPDWLDQIWFAGVHSDIGGSYPENESRLSDIALEWMVHAAENLPDANIPNANGIKVDRRFLKLNPDPCGPQHDATEPGYFGGRVKWWTIALREIDPNAILHPSVYKRFAADEVQHFYVMQPYRPENLSKHQNLKQYYP